MQPIRVLEDILWKNSSPDYFIYSAEDLHVFFPGMSYEALMKMLSRAEKSNILRRVCKGIYLYPKVPYIASKVLYLVACRLRSGCFNYISLESRSENGTNRLRKCCSTRPSSLALATSTPMKLFSPLHNRSRDLARHRRKS